MDDWRHCWDLGALVGVLAFDWCHCWDLGALVGVLASDWCHCWDPEELEDTKWPLWTGASWSFHCSVSFGFPGSGLRHDSNCWLEWPLGRIRVSQCCRVREPFRFCSEEAEPDDHCCCRMEDIEEDRWVGVGVQDIRDDSCNCYNWVCPACWVCPDGAAWH